MQPRIATLLGDSPEHSGAIAPARPLPVEPSPVSEQARTRSAAHLGDFPDNDSAVSARQLPAASTRQKSSVPIAEVLNVEGPALHHPAFTSTPSATSAAPFSGRLEDILLDPLHSHRAKRPKQDNHVTPTAPAPSGNENSLLTLPKPQPQAKKGTRRPRIPPLLQGLHQPPPLPPTGRLFPPITGQGAGFGVDLVERNRFINPADDETDKNAQREGAAAAASSRTEHSGGVASDKPQPTLPTPNSNEESRRVEEVHGPVSKDPSPPKRAKWKRKLWTEDETRDLLLGVERFGIGNWKRILGCPDYTFNSRTAVDLKDRFRTCCPCGRPNNKVLSTSAKRKSRELEAPTSLSTSHEAHPPASSEHDTEAASGRRNVDSATGQRCRPTSHKGPVELRQLGINQPFKTSRRRARREFIEEEDSNILKGFKKYGAVWSSIRDDPELGLSSRNSTDLRDRFRIRYPDMFSKAGYKLKAKQERELKDSSGENASDHAIAGIAASKATEGVVISSSNPSSENDAAAAVPSFSQPSIDLHPNPNSNATPAPSQQPGVSMLLQPMSHSLLHINPEDFADFFSEDDDLEAIHSPITLSRQIFNWADANPTSSSVSAPLPSAGFNIGMSIPTEPSMTGRLEGNVLGPQASHHFNTPSLHASGPPLNPEPNRLSFQTAHSNPAHSSMAAPSRQQHHHIDPLLLGTPNLPNIVYPNVPAASARSAVHNLPPPSDILLGLDYDRPEHGFQLPVLGG